MSRRCFRARRLAGLPGVAITLPFVLAACERSEPVTRNDAPVASTVTSTAPSAAAPADNGWLPAAGPALLVQGASRDEAIALFPVTGDSDAVARLDSVSLTEVPVVLFGRGGTRYSAQLGAPTGEGTDDCERWPLHAFQPGGDASWSVGFASDRVQPVALDSVELLSARDSMVLVAEASRLASSVTAPTEPPFQGLRFTTEDVRRFQAAPGVQALVAHLVRHVNQEASPLEEQTLLVAERDSGVASGPYRLAYAERTSGREEDVVTPEVLAAVRIAGSATPSLIVARDGSEGIAYAMLERVGPHRWRVRWSSAMTSCG
ncbi:MAG TPA: hypothetical protein VFY85_06495 [Gemmatimonadaceae bacterium]|nr:hypothetical protein [Gemmatimonadaceae bacterium]